MKCNNGFKWFNVTRLQAKSLLKHQLHICLVSANFSKPQIIQICNWSTQNLLFKDILKNSYFWETLKLPGEKPVAKFSLESKAYNFAQKGV